MIKSLSGTSNNFGILFYISQKYGCIYFKQIVANLGTGEQFDNLKFVNNVVEKLVYYLYGTASKGRFCCFLFDQSASAIRYFAEYLVKQEIIHHSRSFYLLSQRLNFFLQQTRAFLIGLAYLFGNHIQERINLFLHFFILHITPKIKINIC